MLIWGVRAAVPVEKYAVSLGKDLFGKRRRKAAA